MSTSGYWGIKKGNEEKLIYVHWDSYPSGLGKDVLFGIQNGLDNIEDFFEKVIMVKNIDNIAEEEAGYIVISPSDLVTGNPKEKYYAESAKRFIDNGFLEYGYRIDLDTEKLILYKGQDIVGEINLSDVKYCDIEEKFK